MSFGSIKDINWSILLQADIEEIEYICQTNKMMYRICQDVHFWHSKFKHDHLPLPVVDFETPAQWIASYRFQQKVRTYVDQV